MTAPPPSQPPGSGPADQRRFRDALGTFATGVTIVSTRSGDLVHGMTANGFMSVSLDPALVVVSIATKARMHDLLLQARRYGVSVLAREQEAVSRHFAGRPQAGSEIELVEIADVPLVAGALTHVAARVLDAHPAGDHTLFIGEGGPVRASLRHEAKPDAIKGPFRKRGGVSRWSGGRGPKADWPLPAVVRCR